MAKNIVHVFDNPLEDSASDCYRSDKPILAILHQIYGDSFPENAHIYHQMVSIDHEVTPETEEDIALLASMEGEFFIVHQPEGPTAAVVIAVVAIVAAVAAVFLLRPTIPTVTNRNRTDESPNNALSSRSNQARPLERVPDIYGQVVSIPDLLTVPYTKFDDHVEYDLVYMCVGRGYYDIPTGTIKEDDTPVELTDGISLEVYEPYTSPNYGTPQITLGDAITEPLYYVVRANNVDGLLLEPSNVVRPTSKFAAGSQAYTGSAGLFFNTPISYGAIINLDNDSYFQDNFSAGDLVTWSDAVFDVLAEDEEGVLSTLVASDVDFSGTYEVEEIAQVPLEGIGGNTTTVLKLKDPSLVNSVWSTYGGDNEYYNYAANNLASSSLEKTATSSNTTEWIYIFDKYIDRLSNNFLATSGLYKDDGTSQFTIDVDVKVEYQQLDGDGVPFGTVYEDTITLEGSSTTRKQRAATLVTVMPFTGGCRVRASRVSPTDTSFKGTVVDDIKWRDLYGLSEVTDNDFGDVTTVMARTKATDASLAVKDRKLNMLVTRKLPEYLGGSTFSNSANPTVSTGLVATKEIDDAIFNICRDQFIGNRELDEVDYDQVVATVEAVKTYFGKDEAAEFCYTFDSYNISFEETVAVVAQAAFCSAYRRGRRIKLFFEKENDVPAILFNHRNKIPDSENRNFKFGMEKDYDGIEYTWINPADESATVFYIKDGVEGEYPINPKKIESIGVRNYYQAYWQAWREYNKIRYRHTTVEFTAVGQGELVLIGDKVLVSNNMRTDYQDGEVEDYSGLVITTSQPVSFEAGVSYVVMLQLYNGTIQTINAYGVEGDEYAIALTSSPLLSLITDDDQMAKTKYILVKESEADAQSAFIVTERQQGETNTSTITCINYDSRYYANDANPLADVVGWDVNWGNYWDGQYLAP